MSEDQKKELIKEIEEIGGRISAMWIEAELKGFKNCEVLFSEFALIQKRVKVMGKIKVDGQPLDFKFKIIKMEKAILDKKLLVTTDG